MTRVIGRTAMALVLAVMVLAACSVTPAQREAAQRAWAEQDRENARSCARIGQRYFEGTCLSGGGP